jgi:nitrate reductase alpha subunit
MENKDTNSNQAKFVRAYWNNDTGGNTRLTDEGLVSTASDGSSAYIQNGTIGKRRPDGATDWTLDEKLEEMKTEIAILQSTVANLQSKLLNKENE